MDRMPTRHPRLRVSARPIIATRALRFLQLVRAGHQRKGTIEFRKLCSVFAGRPAPHQIECFPARASKTVGTILGHSFVALQPHRALASKNKTGLLTCCCRARSPFKQTVIRIIEQRSQAALEKVDRLLYATGHKGGSRPKVYLDRKLGTAEGPEVLPEALWKNYFCDRGPYVQLSRDVSNTA